MKALLGKYSVTLISVAVLSACGFSAHDAPAPTGGITIKILNPDLNRRAIAMLTTQCASCHGSSGMGGFSTVTDLTLMVQAGQINPASPEQSKLFLRSVDGSMPPGRGLSAADIELLRQWLTSGFEVVSGTPVVTPAPVGTTAAIEIKDQAFHNQALALFQQKCATCHGARADGNFGDLNRVESMVGRGLIVPGNADGSKFFRRSNDGSMPPGAGLAASEVSLIRQWINTGIALAAGSTPPPPAGPNFPTGASATTRQVVTLLYDRCTSCHNAGSGNTLGGGVLDVIDPANMVTSGLIVPGNAAKSPLYDSLNQRRMPQSPAPAFSAAELTLIRDWINSGMGTTPTALVGQPRLQLTATYASIRANLLATRCILCHGGSLGTRDGKSYVDYTATLRTVVKFNPGQSKLYSTCQSGEMPDRFLRFSTAEVQAIAAWINAGAPNN